MSSLALSQAVDLTKLWRTPLNTSTMQPQVIECIHLRMSYLEDYLHCYGHFNDDQNSSITQ
ncbi:hypothetical protein [Prochlorococcus marinus]|uniref:hypothetical protein n=1 Tax=Prochlorococcus marinus TaxID=1219 RepID=UPI0012DAD3B2|nr:hypothetical protein [Prochlorococcus marinus]